MLLPYIKDFVINEGITEKVFFMEPETTYRLQVSSSIMSITDLYQEVFVLYLTFFVYSFIRCINYSIRVV